MTANLAISKVQGFKSAAQPFKAIQSLLVYPVFDDKQLKATEKLL